MRGALEEGGSPGRKGIGNRSSALAGVPMVMWESHVEGSVHCSKHCFATLVGLSLWDE